MCSVTFWPRRRGYLLAMNRDEQRTRITGLPPGRFAVGDRTVAHPREPGGGTWISVNDRGAAFALVNWYAIPLGASRPVASRGEVVLALRDCTDSDGAAARLRQLPLPRMNPFRVIGIFESERLAHEWRWDLRELACLRHDWAPRQWLSSGHNELAAQKIRAATFESVRAEDDAGSVTWLRRLHASHGPEPGPFSICMHRAEAATVSYTEIEVTGTTADMRHCGGSPCCAQQFVNITIEPDRSWPNANAYRHPWKAPSGAEEELKK
jgi:hypothetical protein